MVLENPDAIDMTNTGAGKALIDAYKEPRPAIALVPGTVTGPEQFSSSALGVFRDMHVRLYPDKSPAQIDAMITEWIRKNPTADDETLMALVATSYEPKTSFLVPVLLALGAAAYIYLS